MISASKVLRSGVLFTVTALLFTACSSATTNTEPGPTVEPAATPTTTPQETALAEQLQDDATFADARTLTHQWEELTSMATALGAVESPDVCQQASSDQYSLLVNAQVPMVKATVELEKSLDELAAGETVTVYFANEQASAAQLHQAHQTTDAQCIEEYDSAMEHDISEHETSDIPVEVHTWQAVATEQLTGRMIDVVSDNILVRYAASYPPNVQQDSLPDDAAEQFEQAAIARALEVFDAAHQAGE